MVLCASLNNLFQSLSRHIKPRELLYVCLLLTFTIWFINFYDLAGIYLQSAPLVVVKVDDLQHPDQCYTNFVYNKENEHLRLKDIQTYQTGLLEESNGRNIFFHLTDCIHDGVVKINPRQACAVESAARANPHLNIFLIYTAPVGFLNKTQMPLLDALMSYQNIHLRNLDLIKYARETPAESWIEAGEMYRSTFMIAHISDFLRLISLYKYGGTYLDLDTISLKNITNLGSNFAGPEHETSVANGVLNIDPKSAVGHKVAQMCLTKFAENYNPNLWSQNGPDLITDVLQSICNTTLTAEMTRKQCEGFKVYSIDEFYCISYQIFPYAFQTNPIFVNAILNIVEEKNPTLIHLSNNLSHGYKIERNSSVAYTILAEDYCPKVFSSFETFF